MLTILYLGLDFSMRYFSIFLSCAMLFGCGSDYSGVAVEYYQENNDIYLKVNNKENYNVCIKSSNLYAESSGIKIFNKGVLVRQHIFSDDFSNSTIGPYYVVSSGKIEKIRFNLNGIEIPKGKIEFISSIYLYNCELISEENSKLFERIDISSSGTWR